MPQPSERLRDLQAKLSAAGSSWEAAETPQARLAPAEKRLLLGAEPPLGAASLEEREAQAKAAYEAIAPASAPGAPTAWDWRDVDGRSFVSAVRNQQSCGSCVAFGTIATVEATMRVKRNDASLAVDLSEAHLFYCHAAEEGRTCSNGWWPDRALEAFKTKGVVDDGCFPYMPGDQPCSLCADWRSRLTKISAYRSLRQPDEMKARLSQNGPLIACFLVYDDFMHYRTGVYRHVSGELLGGHCVSIVGYSDAEGCWIGKNSWGEQWGDAGFFKIARGEVGIDYEMWGVDVTDTTDTTEIKEKRITGLWIIDQGHNAAAYIDDVGWKRIPGTDPAIFAGMLSALASAKAAKSPCNIKLSGEYIKELYVF